MVCLYLVLVRPALSFVSYKRQNFVDSNNLNTALIAHMGELADYSFTVYVELK